MASGFYIINCNSRWMKTKSNHFSQRREGFTSDCLFHLRSRVYERKKCCKYCYYYYLYYCHCQYKCSTASSINKVEPFITYCYYYYLYYCHCQYKCSTASSINKVEPFITSPKYIGSFKKNQCGYVRRGKENKQKGWKTSVATDENQYVYSCRRLFSWPAAS